MINITAHTGCMGHKNNSLEAVAAGFEYADTVEIDVNIDKNGELVLAHDAPRLGKKYVKLYEALKLVRDIGGAVNLDIKHPAAIIPAGEMVLEYSLVSRAFYTGLSAGDMESAQRIVYMPRYLNIMPLSPEAVRDAVRTAVELGCCGLNVYYKLATPYMVRLARRAALSVSVWTVNQNCDMREMVLLGVDNITTLRPDVLRGLLEVLKP